MINKKIVIYLFLFIINSVKSKRINIDLFKTEQNIYIGNMTIGEHGKSYRFLIDTGSPFIWVPDHYVKKHEYYEKTTSFEYSYNISTKISYINGFNITCNFNNENFYINNNIIKNLTFGLCSTFYPSYENYPFDGIMGLGYFNKELQAPIYDKDKNITMGIDTIFKQMDNIINDKLFTLWFDNEIGQLTLGEIESNKYKGDISWLNVNNDNKTIPWFTDFDNISFKNMSFNNNYITHIDSGNSDIYVPTNIFYKLNNDLLYNFNGSIYNEYNRYCVNYISTDNIYDYNITFISKNNIFSISPYDYIYIDSESQKFCSRIMNSNTNNTITLGVPFLQKYFSIYDFNNFKIGLANRN